MMPFVINGTRLNKPAYGGTRLNCIHVWLQNHWTGTENNSTSTLSQDGNVIASNLARDPAISTPLHANAGEGTWVRGVEGSSPSGWRQSITIVKSDWQWLGSLYLLGDDNNVVANPCPGESMTLAIGGMSMRPDDGPVNLRLHAYEAAGWTDITTITLPTTPGWVTATFTMPSDATLSLALYSYYGLSDLEAVVGLDAVLLTTTTDRQAMQARGITWFDGDAYAR